LRGRRAVLAKHRWLTFLLPIAVFMLLTGIEPKPQPANPADSFIAEELTADEIAEFSQWPSIPYAYYPWVYCAKVILTLAAVWFVLPGYRQFAWKLAPLALMVGVVGGVIWIALCRLDIEHAYLQPALEQVHLGWLIGAGARSAYNPFEQIAARPAAWAFLGVRFFGLVLLVPVIEEFFLRGFLMRFVMQPDWWAVPFGRVSALAVVAGTAVPMLMHPAELLAAAVWFTLITWLMVKTRNIWDCVAAHAITNLLLGIYVVAAGRWQLM